VLPGTELALEARELFELRADGSATLEARIGELKLVTPHYQHVDGTSFAAPLVAGIAACMMQSNPTLTPNLIRDSLTTTAHRLPDLPRERQGAGAVHAGRAVAAALREHHQTDANGWVSPRVTPGGVTFLLHQHGAQAVRLLGSWDGWAAAGTDAVQLEPGLWHIQLPLLPPGEYVYKFLVDDGQWADDPANPHKAPDGFGGLNNVLMVPG
jgi:serine protease AprX